MAPGGRDQLGPIERLVRVLAVLDAAGTAGVSQQHLLDAADYGATAPDAQRRMLGKDIAYLNEAGWDIRNVSPAGVSATYVLHARDIRLRVQLAPGEQAELARVGRIAGIDEFADHVGAETEPPEHPTTSPVAKHGDSSADKDEEIRPPDPTLALCLEAAARRRVVQFIYKGRPRTVHPRVVQPGPSGWYLVGSEEASGLEKYFVVDRIRSLVLDQPGSAMPVEESGSGTLDPATWEVDPPVEVEIETESEFAEQVRLALRPVVAERTEDGRTVVAVRVTHRAAFRMRLYALGARVRVIGPHEIRTEILDELTAVAGHR